MSFTRQAWNFYRHMLRVGWPREDAKYFARSYRANLVWDAERANPNLAIMNRGGQI